MASARTSVFTIGHSTRDLDEFIALLTENQIRTVADIRTVPKSRHNPQFHIDALSASLPEAGIEYLHLAALGGLREAAKDSVNSGWRNASFRGYADYLQTDAFTAGLEELIAIARDRRTAIMCAEAVPWRCHRSLVADALLVRGIEVRNIMAPGNAPPAHITPFARVEGSRITYPPEGRAAAR
jgi:uncharacterized protein (DUF488 family)